MTDAAFWNELARQYAAKPVENPDAFDRKIGITKSLMKKDHVVLDVGCGTGSLVLRLAETGAQLHGLDLSDEMTRIAKEKADASGHSNVTFHTGAFDETFSVLRDESLDGICAYSLLHLLEDRTAAISRIFRLLKPGGFFVTSTLCLGESWVPFTPILSLMRWLGKAPLVRVFDKETFAAELENAGFADLKLPDVGAKATVAFTVAAKPARTR